MANIVGPKGQVVIAKEIREKLGMVRDFGARILSSRRAAFVDDGGLLSGCAMPHV